MKPRGFGAQMQLLSPPTSPGTDGLRATPSQVWSGLKPHPPCSGPGARGAWRVPVELGPHGRRKPRRPEGQGVRSLWGSAVSANAEPFAHAGLPVGSQRGRRAGACAEGARATGVPESWPLAASLARFVRGGWCPTPPPGTGAGAGTFCASTMPYGAWGEAPSVAPMGGGSPPKRFWGMGGSYLPARRAQCPGAGAGGAGRTTPSVWRLQPFPSGGPLTWVTEPDRAASPARARRSGAEPAGRGAQRSAFLVFPSQLRKMR